MFWSLQALSLPFVGRCNLPFYCFHPRIGSSQAWKSPTSLLLRLFDRTLSHIKYRTSYTWSWHPWHPSHPSKTSSLKGWSQEWWVNSKRPQFRWLKYKYTSGSIQVVVFRPVLWAIKWCEPPSYSFKLNIPNLRNFEKFCIRKSIRRKTESFGTFNFPFFEIRQAPKPFANRPNHRRVRRRNQRSILMENDGQMTPSKGDLRNKALWWWWLYMTIINKTTMKMMKMKEKKTKKKKKKMMMMRTTMMKYNDDDVDAMKGMGSIMIMLMACSWLHG